MKWLFVTRESYEEVKKELRELKDAHERIVDAAYFIQSGYHLYARFEPTAVTEEPNKSAPKSALVDPKKEAEDIGTNPRTILKTIEAKNITEFEEKRKSLQALAAVKLESALEDGDRAAQGAD